MSNKVSTYFCRFKDVLQDDWRYEKAGRLILLVTMLGLLVIPCVLAYYIPFEHFSWWNIFEKFINEHSLFTSIMGTLIGLIIIFRVLRPRVRIERQLIDFRKEGKWHLKVRVRNLGIFPVNNVEVQLLYYREVEKEGTITKKTKNLDLLRSDSPVLRGILPRGLDTTYGCATKLNVDELIEARKIKVDEWDDEKADEKDKKKEKKYEGILCRVKATHAISGVTYVREHKFKKKEVDEFLNRYSSTNAEAKDSVAPARTKAKSKTK